MGSRATSPFLTVRGSQVLANVSRHCVVGDLKLQPCSTILAVYSAAQQRCSCRGRLQPRTQPQRRSSPNYTPYSSNASRLPVRCVPRAERRLTVEQGPGDWARDVRPHASCGGWAYRHLVLQAPAALPIRRPTGRRQRWSCHHSCCHQGQGHSPNRPGVRPRLAWSPGIRL